MKYDRFSFYTTIMIPFAVLSLVALACARNEGNHQEEAGKDKELLKETFSAERGTLSDRVALIVDGHLYIMDESGAKIVSGWAYGATWSPDGQSLLIKTRGSSYVYSDLVVVSGSDWSVREYLQTDDIMYCGGADWSPDGQNIVFTGEPPDGERLGVYVANKDGTNPELVVHCACRDCCCHPSWSPDGSRIAFWGPEGVEIVEYGNPGSRRLVYPFGQKLDCPAVNVSWFPDSRRLLISERLRILILDLTDDSVDTLVEISSEGATGVFWAVALSDGKHVAYRARYRTEDSGPWYNEMMFANLDDLLWKDITPSVIKSANNYQLYFDWWQAP